MSVWEEFRKIYRGFKPTISRVGGSILVQEEKEFIHYVRPFAQFELELKNGVKENLPFVNDDKDDRVVSTIIKQIESEEKGDPTCNGDENQEVIWNEIISTWRIICRAIAKDLSSIFDRRFESENDSDDFFTRLHEVRKGFIMHTYYFIMDLI